MKFQIKNHYRTDLDNKNNYQLKEIDFNFSNFVNDFKTIGIDLT